MEFKKPKFMKWAFFRVRTILLAILFLYLAYNSASYSYPGFGMEISGFSFSGFLISFISYSVGYVLASYGVYYWKFIMEND